MTNQEPLKPEVTQEINSIYFEASNFKVDKLKLEQVTLLKTLIREYLLSKVQLIEEKQNLCKDLFEVSCSISIENVDSIKDTSFAIKEINDQISQVQLRLEYTTTEIERYQIALRDLDNDKMEDK